MSLSAEHNPCLQNTSIKPSAAYAPATGLTQFAVAGIPHVEDGDWELDDIRCARNANAPVEVTAHFLQWLAMQSIHQPSIQKKVPS